MKELLTASIPLVIPGRDMPKYMDPAIGEIIGVLTAQGLHPAGPMFSYHHRRPSDTFDFEIGFPVSNAIKPEGRVVNSKLPAVKVVRSVYQGPYEGLAQAWPALQNWVCERPWRNGQVLGELPEQSGRGEGPEGVPDGAESDRWLKDSLTEAEAEDTENNREWRNGRPYVAEAQDVKSVLTWLESLGSKRVREDMSKRFGIHTDKAGRACMADMQKVPKSIGNGDHQLAQELWKTGWYEARMVATMIADPQQVTPKEMDAWCKDFDNWAICDTACFKLWDQVPHAWDKVPVGKERTGVHQTCGLRLARLPEPSPQRCRPHGAEEVRW